MSSHTLTFDNNFFDTAETNVKVDGVSVTSPYILDKNCQITANVLSGVDAIVVNGVNYQGENTISLSNTDIEISVVESSSHFTPSFAVIINYTA